MKKFLEKLTDFVLGEKITTDHKDPDFWRLIDFYTVKGVLIKLTTGDRITIRKRTKNIVSKSRCVIVEYINPLTGLPVTASFHSYVSNEDIARSVSLVCGKGRVEDSDIVRCKSSSRINPRDMKDILNCNTFN